MLAPEIGEDGKWHSKLCVHGRIGYNCTLCLLSPSTTSSDEDEAADQATELGWHFIDRSSADNFKYDFVIIFGGLHHCVQNLDIVLDNIQNMLNKNGVLIMVEPNKNYF